MLELFKTETQRRHEIMRGAVRTMYKSLQGMGASNNVVIKTIEANLAVSASSVYRWLVADGLITPRRRTPKCDKLTDKNAGE